jgi:RNA 2',3'-cyclic 3'-phosphodiesterase
MLQQSPHSTQGTSVSRSRLFFALLPDPETREAIYKATRAAVADLDGRPIPAEQFHITLAFLGGVPGGLEERVTAHAQARADELQADPFSFELDEIGFWPNSQVVWYGCSQRPEALRSLAMELRRRLQVAGLPPAPGKFVPHVTLARWVRKAGPFVPARRIVWKVRDFALIRSETLPSGVRYTPISQSVLGRQGVLI